MTETIPPTHRNISWPSILSIKTFGIYTQHAEKLSEGPKEAF